MRKIIIIAALTFFMFPPSAPAASSTTWTYHKKSKTWTVKTKKLKSTMEVIRDLRKKSSRKTK
jgi:hypothetical protein